MSQTLEEQIYNLRVEVDRLRILVEQGVQFKHNIEPADKVAGLCQHITIKGTTYYINQEGEAFLGTIFADNMKSGANQGAAGAAAGELWHDTDDDTIKMGV